MKLLQVTITNKTISESVTASCVVALPVTLLVHSCYLPGVHGIRPIIHITYIYIKLATTSLIHVNNMCFGMYLSVISNIVNHFNCQLYYIFIHQWGFICILKGFKTHFTSDYNSIALLCNVIHTVINAVLFKGSLSFLKTIYWTFKISENVRKLH